ncbi:hypothetical protein SAMN05421770_10653 [Granulicella rosea]|uniref:Dioxygenase n=1 Tax=Granulicella rosea TaxID=474952 RepID=A0A239L2K2_9BACT|nr:intradiol ring-cleavage dioxygenase [Granulicella rosea]SNT24530.1 hypothetical protein SAMN05421770_10653 [Granulicella rosea]
MLSRRRFLASGLVTASALQIGRRALAAETCVLTPEQEIGPFYVADELIRSKIAEGKPGIPLRLRLVVLDSNTCKPLPDAAIDLWHCDAMGLYSGFTASKGGFGPGGPGGRPPGPPPGGFDPSHDGGPPPGGFSGPPPNGGMNKPTDKLTFLRGIQMTAADGSVSFETIFPGFYEGRTNHVHFKVRLAGHRDGNTYKEGHTSHNGQMFFPEDMNLKLMAEGPYAKHAIHRTTMAEDHVFGDQHGPAVIATLLPVDPKHPAAGLVAELHVAVDTKATPAPVGMGGGPGPRR